jgi:hypothetical protein
MPRVNCFSDFFERFQSREFQPVKMPETPDFSMVFDKNCGGPPARSLNCNMVFLHISTVTVQGLVRNVTVAGSILGSGRNRV